MNFMDFFKMIQNPDEVAAKLPPAPVVLGAVSRIIREAIVREMQGQDPPEAFCNAAREFNPDISNEKIVDLYHYLWRCV